MAKNTGKASVYVEPSDYIPEDIRKELKLGEYAEQPDEQPEAERQRANKAIRDFVKGKK